MLNHCLPGSQGVTTVSPLIISQGPLPITVTLNMGHVAVGFGSMATAVGQNAETWVHGRGGGRAEY